MAPPTKNAQGKQPTSDEHERASRRPIRALTILAAFLVPVSLLPYLVARRQLSVLQRQMHDIQSTLTTFRGKLSRVEVVPVATKELQSHVQGAMKRLGELQTTTKKLQDKFAVLQKWEARKDEHAQLRKVLDEAIQDVHRLRNLGERHEDALRQLQAESESRSTQSVILRELGSSLADVAAFMHEIELERGLCTKQPGVDRLRTLALRMVNSQSQSPHKTKKLRLGTRSQVNGSA